MVRLAPLLALLAACGPPSRLDHDDFARETAQLFCQRLKECARGDFERDYFSMDDCAAHWERELEILDEAYEDADCPYDEEGAARAYERLDSMSCEDFYEGEYLEDYDKVWDCPE